MSAKLTTEQITGLIEEDIVPAEWAWESAIESAIGHHEERNAADGARFLEKLVPGRGWSAAEYHGLMYHHFTGRWESTREIGEIRATESHEDGKLSDHDYHMIMANPELAEKHVRDMPGTHVFDCEDGTVLTFDGIFDGTLTEEDPV